MSKDPQPKTPIETQEMRIVKSSEVSQTDKKRVYALDTSVLMHDPQSIFHFQEHDVFVPFQVLHELDRNKKGQEEPALNARKASRLLRKIITATGRPSQEKRDSMNHGFPLEGPSDGAAVGRLFIQNRPVRNVVVELSDGNEGDDIILSAICHVKTEFFSGREVIFVTKDSIALVKSIALGIIAEDYRNDEIRITEDANLLRSGVFRLPADFWDRNELETSGDRYFRVSGDLHQSVLTNEFVLSGVSQNHIPKVASVVGIEGTTVILKAAPHFSGGSQLLTQRVR